MKKLATVLLLSACAAFAQNTPVPAGKNAFDKATLEAYLRHMEMWIAQVGVTISDPKPAANLPGFSEVAVTLSYNGQTKQERYYISSDGKSIVKGSIYAIDKNPFQEALDTITTKDQPSYGDPNGAVAVFVYGDFQCPYCKAEDEAMRANLPGAFPQDVKVYFKDFPLESIHPWARAGSIAGRCVFRQGSDAFWNYHDWIYKVQSEITPENLNERILAWAGENGVDGVQLGRCIDEKATDAEVSANLAEGKALGVDGTPTLVINGRKLPSGVIEWPLLQQLIKLELDHVKQTQQQAAAPVDTLQAAVPGGK